MLTGAAVDVARAAAAVAGEARESLWEAPGPQTFTQGRSCAAVGARVGVFQDSDPRQRDLFPLPEGAALDTFVFGEPATSLSMSQRRRLRARKPHLEWLRSGVHALNHLAGTTEVKKPEALGAHHRRALQHLTEVYFGTGRPPEDLDPLGALSAPQGTATGYADCVAGGGATTYRRGAASLPQNGAGKIDLLGCLPPDLQHKLVGG